MTEEKDNKVYACPECGFHYRDEATAKKCEAWCKEHGSCNAEITKLSVERTATPASSPATPPPDRDPGQTPAGAQDAPVIPAKAGIQNLEEKCAELEANWKRALADYQNLQKEVARERAEMGQYAILRAIERFLPVLDFIKQAISHQPSGVSDKSIQNWIDGIGHLAKLFEDALKDLGLVPIKTVGEPFDPLRHEAGGEEESKVKGQRSNVIVREIQPGYEMGGKVVRPAKVIVSK
jgi:molecular chaperone GrpE